MAGRTILPVQFRMLGPLQVEHEGHPLDLGRPKQRALLALLLVHAGHVVSTDRIVEELWQGVPPADASGAVQVQVSRLRQVLAAGGTDGQSLLESRKPGYVLLVGADDLDAGRFERLVDEGRRATAEGRPEAAAALLTEALALWQGAALADFADQPFAVAEAARLEELRLTAWEERVEAELVLGHHAKVVAGLAQMAADNPLRERLWAQLMLALYRSGRQAESLRAYGELRRNLGDELGITPSPALQRLEEMVLLQKPELDWVAPERPHAPPSGRTRARPTAPLPFTVDVDDAGCPFVGRGDELEQIDAAWRAVTRPDGTGGGGPRLVLLAGEPGIGKTRLAMEAARTAHRQGAGVLVGRCDDGLAVPYQPFAEAMAKAVRHLPAEDLTSLLGGRGGELVRLVPELADLAPSVPVPLSSDPETDRYRMFEATGQALAALARRAPVVLVLDDLHWATRPTLLLLRHVITKVDGMPLLVIGTYRDTEVDEGHPLTEVLGGRMADVTRIRLSGLGVEDVRAFIQAVDASTTAQRALSLHDVSAGNALFMREMLRHLDESGFDESRPGDVPDSIKEVVRRRLSRLSAATNRLLSVASVIGTEYDLAVLQAAVGFDEDSALSGLEEAIHAGLVAEVAGPTLRQRFTHGLVRDVLYDELSAGRRAQLHRRVGEAIELASVGRPEDLPELARHFARAAAIGGAPKAVAYSNQAGGQALAQLAHDDAARHFRQGLELLDLIPVDPGDEGLAMRLRCDLLMSLGEAQKRCGDPSHRRTLLDAAALAGELGDAGRMAAAALANTRGFWSATRRVDADRVATFEAALAALDPGDGTLRASLLARLAVELVYSGDVAAARRLSDEALTMARRLGDLPTLAQVLAPRYNTIRGDPATLPERLADTAELLAVAQQLPDAELRCEAWAWRAVATMEAADTDEAAACLEAHRRLAGQLRQPTLLWYSTYLDAGRALLAARFDDAERLAVEANQLGHVAGQPDADMFLSVQRMQLAYERGTLGRWERPLRIALARDPDSRWFLRSWQALCACEKGDVAASRRCFDELAAKDFADHAFEPTWLHIVANCAVVCAHLGDSARAGRLVELLEPFADQLVTLTSLAYCGGVSHYLGMLAATLGEDEAADRWFAAAAELHRRIDAPGWLARTQLEWGRSLLARGNAAGGKELLEAAGDTATRLGMSAVERQAKVSLSGGVGAPR